MPETGGDFDKAWRDTAFQILNEDQELQSLIGNRIYTFVPDNPTYPYVQISSIQGADGGTKTSPGQNITWMVSIFDREKTDIVIANIKRRIVWLFHEKQPDVEGAQVGVCRFLSSHTQPPNSDGTTRQSVIRFRVNLYEE